MSNQLFWHEGPTEDRRLLTGQANRLWGLERQSSSGGEGVRPTHYGKSPVFFPFPTPFVTLAAGTPEFARSGGAKSPAPPPWRSVQQPGRVHLCYVAEILFWQQQEWLPPRMRMTEAAVVSAVMGLGRLGGRKLHRRLSELGRKANLYVPPWRAQCPTTVPTDLRLEANRNGVRFEHFLEMWGKALKQDATERQRRQEQS